MKKSYYVGLFMLFAGVFSPAVVQADEISSRGPIPFSAYDKDGNNLISEQEFNLVREERMSIRAAEGRPMRGASGAPTFAEFDANADGQLTHDELVAGQNAQMEKRAGMGMGMGQGNGMGKGSGMSNGMGMNMPAYAEYDLNGDGEILEKEFYEARNKRISERAQQGYQMRNLASAPSFTDIDTNGDGVVSAEEFTAHQTLHRQQMAQ
jgi:Ca2+-binding EF-hand superfamily protein